VAVVLVALALVGGAWRARTLTIAIAWFYWFHDSVGHKEFRFVVPMLPLVCALTGVGLYFFATRLPRRAYMGLVGLTVVLSLFSTVLVPGLKFRSVGSYGPFWGNVADQSALDYHGPLNRLLIIAGRQSDNCGIKVEEQDLAVPWTGAYTYFNRNVPLYTSKGPPRGAGVFNYVIEFKVLALDTDTAVASDGDRQLVRLGPGPCNHDPTFTPVLVPELTTTSQR
jgi:hypothetical protein